MEQVELLILKNLLYNEDYVRKVIPFLKSEYFENQIQKIIFEEIFLFVEKYNKLATKEILCIELEKRSDISDSIFKEAVDLLTSFENESVENNWLISTTESWCRDRAIYLALVESIHIADGKNEQKSRNSIPSILESALAVSFDNHIGHDYFEDYEKRYESYRAVEDKISFDITYLNKITKGGISKKTLTILMAPTGLGKSLALCHIAASTLLQNKNVLYITLEMSEEKISERIDANLMNINIKDFPSLPKNIFESKINSISKKTQGSLIVKEYPTSSAHTGHFKSLINELRLKKSFNPDLIIVDYMNICASSRYKSNFSVNSYSYVKAIAEELRGLAVECNVPLLTATQVNRCLSLDTILEKKGGETVLIKNINVGDEILSHSGYVKVQNIFPIETQEVYEIETKSGKKIICSSRHIFPTDEGEKNILSGLKIGDNLFTIK